MAIIDAVSYNGEQDLLEIRLNILDKYVDNFIIVEFDQTFSGKPKESWYKKQEERFAPFKHKIRYYYMNTETLEEKYGELADKSPNVPVNGPAHWRREFCQKEGIKDCLTDLNDTDTVFVGDCDEIWNEDALGIQYTAKLCLWVYTYYLNNKSSEEFYGTLKTDYETIKNNCLNDLRTTSYKTINEYGWHFTSLREYMLERKMTDSYTQDSYANDFVMNNLKENIDSNKDFLGRNFTFTQSELLWPQWLVENKQKYLHLCMPEV